MARGAPSGWRDATAAATGSGGPCRRGRAAHPQTQEGQPLPAPPRATPDGRAGAHRGDPGGLHPRRLHALGRRAGQGHGHERHSHKPGLAPVRGDRRQGEGLPAGRRRRALPLAGRNLCEGPSGQSRRLGRRDRRGRRQQRRPSRGPWHDIGPSEAEAFWAAFLRKLARRGLRRVKLAISDAHEGIKAAAAKVLSATWQRCGAHFARNALAHAGRGGRRVVAAFIATGAHGACARGWATAFRTMPMPPRVNGARRPASSGRRCPGWPP